MLNLVFGVPTQNQRGASKEKYTDKAVLTMLADKGKKTAKKFEFNKLASEQLCFADESTVAISFLNGAIYLVNSTNTEASPSYIVTKNKPRSFSNSKIYDYITTFLGLSNSVDNEFELVKFDDQMFNNAPIFKVVLISNEQDLTPDFSHIEAEIEDEIALVQDTYNGGVTQEV